MVHADNNLATQPVILGADEGPQREHRRSRLATLKLAIANGLTAPRSVMQVMKQHGDIEPLVIEF
jgi:hypothetical protein